MATKQTKTKQSKAKQQKDYFKVFQPYIANLQPGSDGEYNGLCPFHDDNRPSFSLNRYTGLWNCHAGCGGGNAQTFLRLLTEEDIEEAEGEDSTESTPAKPKRNPVALYNYKDEGGKLIFQAVRFEPKGFAYRRPDGEGGWICDLAGVERIPYRLYDLTEREPEVLYIAEGEKDVDRLWSIGLPATCNPGGAEKWKDEYTTYLAKRLPLLEVVILADADEPGRKHAIQVAKSWMDKVRVVRILRDWPGGVRDVSDYLDAGHSKEDLEALIQKTEPFTRQDLERIEEQAKLDRILAEREAEDMLHPAQDFHGGVLYYGITSAKAKPGLCLITSEHRALCGDGELPGNLKIDDRGFNLFRFSREGLEAYQRGETVNGHDLLSDLAAFFRRYAVFPDERMPELLAAWTLGTYLYRVFNLFPYVALRSPLKQCGKSRVLDLLSLVAFNASRRMSNPTAPILFRGPSRNGGTLLLDEVEYFQGKNKENYNELVAVLNSGFEKGGVVERLVGDQHEVRSFSVYCPRALAGIAELPETVEDRAIVIFMQRKQKTERLEPFDYYRLNKGEARQLRDRCYRWALAHAREVAAVYEVRDFPGLKGLDDRARDLWETLLTIARLVDKEAGTKKPDENYETALTALAHTLSAIRDEGETRTAKLIGALTRIVKGEGKEHFTPTELLKHLQLDDDFSWLRYTSGLAGLLKPLGFLSHQAKVPEGKKRKSIRLYHIPMTDLEGLARRYGGVEAEEEEGEKEERKDKPARSRLTLEGKEDDKDIKPRRGRSALDKILGDID